MALEGDLGLFRLPDILQVIAQQRKTGILTVQGQSDILAVSFLEGEIVSADALNRSFEDLLGEVLADRNAISAESYAQLSRAPRGAGERLIDHLVAAGAIGREELLESLRDLTYRLLVDVLRWREGQFKFYGGEEVAYEEGIRPLRVEDVLMRAIGDLGADGGGGRPAGLPSGFLAYERVPDNRLVQVISAGFEESVVLEPGVVWLTPDESALLERIDGTTPAETLARQSGVPEARTYYSLYRLLQAGLVRPAGEGEGPVAVRATPAAAPARAARAEALRAEVDPLSELLPPALAPAAFARFAALAGRVLPLVLAVLILGLLYRNPAVVLFPAPGLTAERESFDRLRRLARFEVIDRAARTHHLVEGRYPSRIQELIDFGLLSAHALQEPRGAHLALRARDESYEILVVGQPGRGMREGVYGDFLLDRALFAALLEDAGLPLVLID
jgi:hypothetical protein